MCEAWVNNISIWADMWQELLRRLWLVLDRLVQRGLYVAAHEA